MLTMRWERSGRTYDHWGEELVGVGGGRIWRPPRRLARRVRVPKSSAEDGGQLGFVIEYKVDVMGN